MKKTPLLIFVTVMLSAGFCHAQEIVNGSFEMLNSKGTPRNWNIDNKDNKYRVSMDSLDRQSGRYALRVDGSPSKNDTIAKELFIYNGYGLTSARKIKAISITGWIKTADKADSTISLIVQDLRGEKLIRCYPGPSKPGTWQKIEFSYTPDSNKAWYGFYYGVAIKSKGLIWVDNINIKVDGVAVNDPVSTSFEPGKENIRWLNANLHPLVSTAVVLSQTDLLPIGQLCGSARVAGIGEPTHGTAEAFKFKLRLLDYLVKQKGFNTIAMEEVIPICDIMNSIINTNKAAIKDSLLSLPFYKCWKTAEVTALLNWVSDYNSNHPNKVKFIGIDMEDRKCQLSRKLLRAYGQAHNKAVLEQSTIIDAHIETLITWSVKDGQEAQALKLADSIKVMFANLQQLLKNDGNLKGKEQSFQLQSYVRVCLQWVESRFYNGARDQYMADNIVSYTKAHPKDKMLVWAHDVHIAKAANGDAKQMGAYLRDSLGKAYVAIGFTSAQGSYTSATDYTQKHWKTYSMEKAYRGTYEYILSKAKSDLYFLPLNTGVAGQRAAFWLTIPMKHLDVAYIQSGGDDYNYYGNMDAIFDGVVFCKSTTASNSYLLEKQDPR